MKTHLRANRSGQTFARTFCGRTSLAMRGTFKVVSRDHWPLIAERDRCLHCQEALTTKADAHRIKETLT